ncbi:MAG: heme ABC transporter ATP-binding protein [Moritella sp.]|uniref:heme ABC transporter ATP-binding protein n=1 Tax=Moritella sp. TaxID=78556 RepID=UPI0029BF362D|nr:heme ABC transporter ATP-binding protein [Moritella sp.]MDX2321686.1 heme ABC transporter ATP-binding protein [Moritella sp.]
MGHVIDRAIKNVMSMHNVTLRFGNKTVLDKVNLGFNAGQLTAILGPNGTGKSSCLKVMTQELPLKKSKNYELSYDDLTLFGESAGNWQPNELAKSLGVLPQSSNLTFNFSVQEVIELGAIPLTISPSQRDETVKTMMEKVGVSHLADARYPLLSGGEKQRVHLARVLTQLSLGGDKKMLLLDEPTAALDIEYQHKVLILAKQLAQAGAAVIIVIHDLNLASQYADRLVILNKGHVVADGSPADVITEQNISKVYQHAITIMQHPEKGYPVVL